MTENILLMMGASTMTFLISWVCIFPSLVYKCVSIKDKVDIRNNTHLPPHTHTHTHTHYILGGSEYIYIYIYIYIVQSENRVSNDYFHSTASPSYALQLWEKVLYLRERPLIMRGKQKRVRGRNVKDNKKQETSLHVITLFIK